MNIQVNIDHRTVTVPEGSKILDAARSAGIDIPVLCHMDGIKGEVSCMICVVKVVGREELLPACAVQAWDGMVVLTGTDEVMEARKNALSLLLSEHAGDCVAPCERACPYHVPIGRVIEQVRTGQNSPDGFLDFPCHGCKAPCETACRRRRIDSEVKIKCIVEHHHTVNPVCGGVPPVSQEPVKSLSKLADLTPQELSRFLPGVSGDDGREGLDLTASALQQALRCLDCGCRALDRCGLRLLAEKYQVNRSMFGGERIPFERLDLGTALFERGKCIACRRCVRICETRNIHNGFTVLDRGFKQRIGLPLDDYSDPELILAIRECVRCCPTGALVNKIQC